MKTTHGLLLAAAVVFGLSAAQSRTESDDYHADVLLRIIPDISSIPYQSKDEEIAALKQLVGKLRDEVVNRNDEIYMLRASERHATKAADDCSAGKYSEQFRY